MNAELWKQMAKRQRGKVANRQQVINELCIEQRAIVDAAEAVLKTSPDFPTTAEHRKLFEVVARHRFGFVHAFKIGEISFRFNGHLLPNGTCSLFVSDNRFGSFSIMHSEWDVPETDLWGMIERGVTAMNAYIARIALAQDKSGVTQK